MSQAALVDVAPSTVSSSSPSVSDGRESRGLEGLNLRQGDASDFAGIARLSEAVYGVPRSMASIRWLYERNPAGQCSLWLAEEAGTGRIVALRPVFPWRLRVGGRNVLVRQAGDAMTHPDFRGRGIFSALVRAAWSELVAQGVPFSFSFSNPGSLSVYRKTKIGKGARVGTHEVLRFRRMVYPLSLRLVRERFALLAGLAGGANVLYQAMLRRRWALPGHLTVSRLERFDSELDELWARTADEYGVLTVRDSRYLNWRFIDAPTQHFQALALRSRGQMVGYIVLDVDPNRHACIADLFALPDPDIISRLLGAGLSAAMEQGCLRASIWSAEESRFSAPVRKFGFIPRDDCFPMAVHVFNDGPEARAALDGGRWLAWFGDRDVEQLGARPLDAGKERTDERRI